jgi:predicted TIM-barrel fold metal-dependent hydrolase
MIIDSHCHPFFGEGMHTKEMLGYMAPMFSSIAGRMGREMDQETFVRKAMTLKMDPSGENMIASMDEAGIDLCILVVMDMGDPAEDMNKIAGEIVKRYPDRVVALAGVDPRDPGGPDKLKKCMEEYGLRGLKYHADSGFDAAGPESYKLLEIVAANNGILVSHTGPLGGVSRSSLADVSHLGDVVVDFPQLTVVAAHMGFTNWRPWASLAQFHENMYGDLAMWDERAFGNYRFFCRELRDLIDCAGVSKVMFGTDDPHFGILRSTREWVELIKDLPTDAPDGIEFTVEEVDAILGGNAARILRI